MGKKKNLPKIILCMCLVSVMLFAAACSGNGGTQDSSNSSSNNATQAGRYVESDVTPPIGGSFQTYYADGDSIVCFDSGLANRYESKDGGATWDKTPGPGAGTDRYKNVQYGSMASDGTMFVYIDQEGLFKIAPTGGEEQIQIKDLDDAVKNGDNVRISNLQALSPDRILLSWMTGGNFMVTRNGQGATGQPSSVSDSAGATAAGADNQGEVQSTDSSAAGAPAGVSSTASSGGSASGGTFINAPVAVNDNAGNSGSGTQSGSGAAQSNGGATQSGGNGGGGGGGGGRSANLSTGLYASDGSLVADLSNLTIGAAATDGTALYLLDSQNSQILTYTLSDGKQQANAASRAIPGSSSGAGGFGGPGGGGAGGGAAGAFIGGFGGGSVLAADSKGTVYLMSGSDLIQIGADGQSAVLLSGTSYTTGTPRITVSAILPMSDGSYIVSVSGADGSNKLYKYVWDASATVDPSKTLDIWSLNDSTFVRAAISDFRKTNPDTQVNYEVALTGDSGATADDAIKNLNTRMLGGDAPDIIILDGCPIESYSSQGLLLDLSSLVDTSKMFDNILTPFKTNSNLWYVPTQLSFPVLIGQQDSIGAVNSLETLSDAIVSGNDRPAITRQMGANGPSSIPESERPAFYFTDLRSVFDLIWDSSAAAVVHDNTLDTTALKTMLTTLKAISDKYGLEATQNGNGSNNITAMFSDGGGAVRVPESAIMYSMERANYGALNVSSLNLLALQSERPGSTMTAFPGLTADSFLPSTLASVSADTKVKDLAVAFVQTMLGIDVQGVSYNTGLPVTEEGVKAQIDAYNARQTASGRTDVTPLDYSIVNVVQGLKEPVITDDVLTTAVWTDAESLCKGDTDIDTAIKNIEQNVKNYLAERA